MIRESRKESRRDDPWIDLAAAVVRQAVDDYRHLVQLGVVAAGRRVWKANRWVTIPATSEHGPRSRRIKPREFSGANEVDALLAFLFGGGVQDWCCTVVRLPANFIVRLRGMQA